MVRMFLCAALAALSISVASGNNTIDVLNVTQSIAEIGAPELEFLDLRRHPLRGSRLQMPCSCGDLSCGCCVGMRVQALGFERNACMNLTYEPYDFAIEANFLMNDESLFRRSISAKNLPPLCMPVPVPVLPTMNLCVRIFDVYTPGVNLHACMDLEARLLTTPLLVLHFDCMVMGRDGVSLTKPGLPVEPGEPDEPGDPGGDEFYDEVTEDRTGINKTKFTSTVSTSTAAGTTPSPQVNSDQRP